MAERIRELFETVTQNPNNQEAISHLEEALNSAEDWDSLLRLYNDLGGLTEGSESSRWYRKAAEISEEKLEDPEGAIGYYNASLAEADGNIVWVLEKMRKLLKEIENWEGFLEVSQYEAEHIQADEDREALSDLYFEMAGVYELQLGDEEQAIAYYKLSFDTNSQNIASINAAQRIFRNYENWEWVAELLEIEYQSIDNEERHLEILLELRDIAQQHLEQPELAQNYFEQYIQIQNSQASEAPAEELSTSVDDEELQEVQEVPELLPATPPDILAEIEKEAPPESLKEPPTPPAPLSKSPEPTPPASLSKSPEPTPSAPISKSPEPTPPVSVPKAPVPPTPVSKAPASPTPLSKAPEAIESSERSLLFGASFELSPEQRERNELLLAQPAPEDYLEALKEDPPDVSLYWGVGKLIDLPEEDLRQIWEQIASLRDEDFAAQGTLLSAHYLLFGAARLEETKAVDFRLRDLAKKSKDPRVQHWQIQRLLETNKWRNIQQLLIQELGGDPNKARLQALKIMARLAEKRSGEVNKAADFWRQVHQADKKDSEARRALLRLYERIEKWPAYVDVLKIEVEGIPDSDPEAKIAGYRKLVAVCSSHLKQDTMVLNFCTEIWKLDPEDPEAIQTLTLKYESLRRWPELVKLLKSQAKQAEGEKQILLNLKIAKLYLEKLRNQAEAIKSFELVIEQDPECLEAIEALDKMYEKRKNWPKLVQVRQKLAELKETPEEQLQAYKALAEYGSRKIKRPEICLPLWEDVRALDPEDLDTLKALSVFYEQSKNWEKLVQVIDEYVIQLKEPKEQVTLLQKAGIVLQDRINDKERAVIVWKQLLEVDPSHRRAGDSLKKALVELQRWEELTEFFGRQERWSELVRILEGQVGIQKDESVRIELLFRAAHIWEEHVQQKDRAVRALERIMQIQSDNLKGARALNPIYEENKDYRKLALNLEVLLGHEEEPQLRGELMLRLSQLKESFLRKPDEAFKWLREALSENPSDERIQEELERLGGNIDQWQVVQEELTSALERVSANGDGEAQLALLLRLARIFDVEMQRYDEALSRYDEALELAPENVEALNAVEALYTRMASWPELLEILGRKLYLTEEPELRKELLRKQGLIFEEHLEDFDSAIEQHRSVLKEDELDEEALSALHRLYEQSEMHQELHEILEIELQIAEEAGRDIIDLKLKLGLIELHRLLQATEAITRFQEILQQQPEHVKARSSLESLLEDYEHRGRCATILEPIYQENAEWPELIQSLEVQLEETEPLAERVGLLDRIGTLHIERCTDLKEGFEAFARILREKPDSAFALQRLDNLADADDRWSALAQLLEEVTADLDDEQLARDLLSRLAAIYEDQLKQDGQAIEAHRRVLEIDAENQHTIESLERLYLHEEEWSELLAIYRLKLELSSEPERQEVLRFQIANLLENMLEEPQEAISVYKEILESSEENRAALEALDRLYEQESMWDDLAEILVRELSLSVEKAEEIGFRVRLASLHEQELNDLETAIGTYEVVLGIDPDNLPALESLERLMEEPEYRLRTANILESIHELHDHWRKLIEIYEIQREESEDSEQKVALLHRIAVLHQDRGGDPQIAFESYARAFRVNPSEPKTLGALHEIAEALELWEELVDVYQGKVDEIDEPDIATDIHKRVAQVLLRELNRLENARTHYEAAYQNDDSDLESIEALEEIYQKSSQWSELVFILLRKSELKEDLEEKKALYFRTSDLYEKKLDDLDQAVEIYQMVLKIDEVDAFTLTSLERLFRELERWEDLHEVLETELQLTLDSGEDPIPYKLLLGVVELDSLGQIAEAITQFEEILELNSEHNEARLALEGLLDDLDYRAQVAQILEPIYQEAREWGSLVTTLEIQLEETLEPPERIEFLERIGVLHIDRTSELELAFEAFARMLREKPESEAAIRHLDQLADAIEHWAQLAELLEEVIPEVQEDELGKQLLGRLALIYRDQLQEKERAIGAFVRILDIDPDHMLSIESLESLYLEVEEWDELLSTYRRKLELLAGADERQLLQFQIAELLEKKLEDYDEAIAVYGEILQNEEECQPAFEALDRLYAQREMWPELADILGRRLDLAHSEEERISLRVRLGKLREEELNDVKLAIETYRVVLECDPDNQPALEALEGLIQELDYRGVIAEILEPIHERHDDWRKLIEIFEIQREESGDDGSKVALLHRIAGLHRDRGGDAEEAFRCFARAFVVDPSDQQTIEQLHLIAEALEFWPELIEVYEEQVLDISDPSIATDIHKRVAQILREQLDEIERSRGHYEAAYSNDDDDMEVVHALDEIYLHMEQWHELVEILRRKAELVEDAALKKEIFFRVSTLYRDKLGNPEEAVNIYTMILELDPQDIQALESLEHIFLELEHWEDLIEILQKQSELSEELQLRKKIYARIGATYEVELDDLTRAVETYLKVLEWDAIDANALQRLDSLYQKMEHWDDLLEILLREVKIAEEEPEQIALRYRIGRIHEVEQEDTLKAIEVFQAILEDEPQHEETLRSLELMVQEDREAEHSAAVLESVLSNQGSWQRLISVWRDLLEVMSEPESRFKLLHQIAQAHEEMLLEDHEAFTAYGEALRENPEEELSLICLERVAARSESWEPLTILLEDEIPNLSDEEIVQTLYLRIARIFEEELGKGVEAIERFRQVLEINPEHKPSILALDRLYQREGMWPDLAETLQQELEWFEESERLPLLLRLGALFENNLEEIEQAIAYYREALDVEAQEPQAVAALENLFSLGHEQPVIAETLEPLYAENREYEKLHDLLQALLAHEMPGEDRMRGMHRLAQLSLEHLQDPSRAFGWYGLAFKEVPDDEHSREELTRLGQENGRFVDLISTLHEGLEITDDMELKASICHQTATLYRQELKEDASAEQMYQYILTHLDEVDAKALSGLDELFEAQHRWQELVQILQREIGVTFEEQEIINFMFRLGQIFETYLVEFEAAVEQYTGILEREPDHPGALEHLEKIYSIQEEWSALFEILNLMAENTEEDSELRSELLMRQALLASDHLDRSEDAVDLWNQVLELRGEDQEALRALEKLYDEHQSWRELVDICERQINILHDDPERELNLYAKLGRVWGNELQRERNALENWHKVLEQVPQNEEALWAIKELYERIGEESEIAGSNHLLLEVLPEEDHRRIDLFRQLGQLYQEVLEQPLEAIKAWNQLLAFQGQDPEAIDALEELYTISNDWPHCVSILDRKVEITEDPYEQVSILFRMGEMYEENLYKIDEALNVYRRVLEIQENNPEAFQQLERIYQSEMQWEELVNLLLKSLEFTEDLYERQEIFLRMAKTFEEKLNSVESAFVVLGQAFELSREDERFGDELERLAEISDKWAEMVTLYEGVIQELADLPDSVPLHLRVARLYDEKLDQPQHAGTHYQHVLSIEFDNIQALTALELLLERFSNWPKVVDVLRQKVELLVDPDARRESFVKLAQILERQIDKPDEAIDAYRQVLLSNPEDLEVLESLERLYILQQRWQDLITVLEQQANILTESERMVENHLRIGELWESRLGLPERAVEAYRQAILIDDHCIDAMQALEKLYTQRDDWIELLDIYEMMLYVRTEPAEQLRTYSRIAMIQEEELNDSGATIETYRKMLEVDPSDPMAVRALDRLYRDDGSWEELAEIYLKHLEPLQDPQEQIRVRSIVAEIYTSIEESEKAIEVLKPVLVIDPNHRKVLHNLGDLYEKVGEWNECIELLSQESRLTQDRLQLLDLHERVGRLYQEHLGDLEQAELWFRNALEHNRNHLPSLGALKEIYEQRAEWTEVIRTLKMMETATRVLAEKSQHLYEIGAVYQQHIADMSTAIDYYEQAMDLHQENVQAAQPLVEVYWEEQRWERAEPLLDLLLLNLKDNVEIRERQHLYFRIAYCAEQLKKDDKALNHYRNAYELDSTHLKTLRGMGSLLFRRGDWNPAFKIYQTILVHHRESLDSLEIVEIFHAQGQIKLKLGERRKALDSFRKALGMEPQHLESLHAIISLHESQGDWEDVIAYRRQLIPLLESETERFQALVNVGDILNDQIRNKRLSVDAYNEALLLQPNSKLILSKLLGIHEGAGEWSKAVDILIQLADLDDKLERRAKYYYAIGAIQRDYLKDSLTAVRSFDKALDASPNMLKAFQAIDQILTNDRDYRRQDRYYRKMLKRATETGMDDRWVISLAKNLGEINRSRLKNYDEAIKAYKIALSRKADDVSSHQIMAELYELSDQVDKAIAQHYRLIELNPRNIESYQNLRRLYMTSSRYDEAWCVCQVLTFLGSASQDEREFFTRYRHRTLAEARKQLSNEHWGLIYHPDKSNLLDQLFTILYPLVFPLMKKSPRELRINKRRHIIDPNEKLPFNSVMSYVARVTRLQRLDCYRSPTGQPGIWALPLNPPAIMVGADITSGQTLQQLAFISAKQLLLMGRQYFLATMDESYEMRKTRLITLIYTLTKLVRPQSQIPQQYFNEDIYNALRRADTVTLNRLSKLLQKIQEDPNQHLNISKWLEMLEHSANRLGLLLSNDVASAVQVIKNEAGDFSQAPAQDRIRELVLFALSEQYFSLRKALGLAIGQS